MHVADRIKNVKLEAYTFTAILLGDWVLSEGIKMWAAIDPDGVDWIALGERPSPRPARTTKFPWED